MDFEKLIGNGGEIMASFHSLVLYLLCYLYLLLIFLTGYFCLTQFGDSSLSLNFN